MVRPRSTTVSNAKPPAPTVIQNQFEISRDTCFDMTDSYSTAHAQQAQPPKGRTGPRIQPSVKRAVYTRTTHTSNQSSRVPSRDMNAQYSLFESRRRPKSAKVNRKTPITTSPIQRSKSTLPFTRSVTPQMRSPTPRPLSVTLTPKTVTPRLTKCKDLKPKSKYETPRQVFSTFKPKTNKLKTEDEPVSDSFKSGSRSNTPHDRMMVSRTFASTPAASQSTSGTVRQSPSPRHKSTKELFCNCASGHPKTSTKYATNLTTWNGHEATTKDYEKLVNMWSTQGLHWIRCAGGEMCSRAVEGGHTRSGEPLYIARALTPDKNKCIGTYHPMTGLCYVPWKGREIATEDYELLCYRSRLQAPPTLYSYTPTTTLVDTLKVLTLRNRRQTTF